MLASRAALSQKQWRSLSDVIQHRFLTSRQYETSKMLMLYMATKGEVDTFGIFTSALETGKKVALPMVAGHQLSFHEVSGESDMQPGAYGIREPRPDCPVRQPHEADCILIPGVAFDLSGRRIGYGKGYYDRALHQLEGSGRLIGFCFEFQVVEEIVGEPHDVALDLIITEQRVISVRNT